MLTLSVGRMSLAERLALIEESAAMAARRAARERGAVRPMRRRICVVEHLLATGRLRQEEWRAAGEILRVWTALTSALFARTGRYGDVAIACAAREDWPASLTRAYRERYCPWRDEAGAIGVRGRTTLADLVFMLAVDNSGVRQVADRLGMDQRRVVRLAGEGLWRYAEIGGWCEMAPAAQRGLALATFRG